MQRSTSRLSRALLSLVLTGSLYFVAATFALLLSRFEGGLAFIWGANAYVMAKLLTTRVRRWPPIILTCAIASALSTSLFGMGPLAAIPMAVINMAEALIVALICRHFLSDRPTIGATRPLMIFILALCAVADVITGIPAAAVASLLTPVSFGASWVQWYTGHALGGLICAPILVMLMQGELRRWRRDKSRAEKIEAVLILALFTLIIVHIFYWARYPMLFAPLLPLVLIAFRVGHMGAAASIVILALVGGTATLSGGGPLTIVSADMGARIQAFQFYLALSFLLSMPVAAELNGRRRLFQLLRESEARYRAIAAHRRALMRPGSIHTVEFRPLLSIGAMEWCEMVTRAVVDERGQPSGVISTIRDMSRHKARQRALQQVAARDSLTGADSRRAFLEKLEAEILRTRHGVRSSLLLIDIDHFKAVNDVHGHGVGDEVLTAFVDRLTPGLSAQDSIGRLGGEEFAILLPDSDIDRASLLCERLRALLLDPIPVSCGKHIGITFSAGLVELDDTSTRSAMLEAADKALYRAKHSGRNCLRLAA
ncbi:diguanylate cyclase [Sphingobium sp. SA2]|uniref:sensor domain-containing diguanylate cyclase n=1 Tax=Sphingobium sp. SA2 TaxID=1524832 RepID=UPI0028C162C5|nr:diguanylate cyclase [Sphingobium sp. SA2]MDT7533568.1 diguanylate cyclase [Sphingobium sp. SA2]